jgi:hypothetical protein
MDGGEVIERLIGYGLGLVLVLVLFWAAYLAVAEWG